MKTVAVAVSGGVDSLCTLIKMQRAGYTTMAIHGRFQPELPPPDRDPVPLLRENCTKLGISLHVADLREEFDRLIIGPFIEAYAAGKTPNPCSICNARVKFGLLMEAAASHGAEYLATGHYVRLTVQDGVPHLRSAADSKKDQSYFLSLVPAHRLARAIFPLGEMTKDQTRAYVAETDLVIPLPKESQDVCFVPQEYRPFVEAEARRRGIELGGRGGALLPDGTRVGTHRGLWQYTEGQRKGLGFAWKEPLFVQYKDLKNNILHLVPRADLGMHGCITGKANFLVPPSDWPAEVLARLRYRQAATRAKVTINDDGSMRILLDEQQIPTAPGQLAALYAGDGTVLGGAEITEIL